MLVILHVLKHDLSAKAIDAEFARRNLEVRPANSTRSYMNKVKLPLQLLFFQDKALHDMKQRWTDTKSQDVTHTHTPYRRNF